MALSIVPPATERRIVRILIVDDQPIILKRVRSILEEEPSFEICGEAYDGEQAILEAVRLEPDVIVLNVSMP
jgi:chemotaxis response regulator CheB